MGELRTNFGNVADEYASIPESITGLLTSLEGLAESVEANLTGEVDAADAFVDSFRAFESAVKTFDTETTRFLAMLREERVPDTVEDIQAFRTAAFELIAAADELRDDAAAFSEVAVQLGLSDAAEAIQTLSDSLADINPSIRTSFIDNLLITAVTAYYFPGTMSESELARVVETIETDRSDYRQNAYFVLALLAENNPEIVAAYSETLAARIATGTTAERGNLLAVLYLLQKQEQLNIDPEAVLKAIDSNDPRVALHAAMILGRQSTSSEQAAAVSKRIVQLLPKATEPDIMVNATYVLYLLAKDQPEAVQDAVAPAAKYIDSDIPTVQENVIEFLGHAGAAEYMDAIADCRDRTTTEAVRVACDMALEQLESAQTSATEPAEQRDAGSDILDEMEAAFKGT
jgi:hypothetical protein